MLKVAFTLFFFCLTTLATPVKVEQAPQWLSSFGNVVQGEFTIISCRGQLKDAKDTILIDHVSQKSSVSIYNGKEVNSELEKRYYVKENKNAEEVTVINIVIAGLREEDSGEYICYMASAPHLKSTFTLTVPIRINSISFTNLGLFSYLRTPLQLRQGQESGIKCSVVIHGTRKVPTMKVETDDDTDVSHLFTFTSEVIETNKGADVPIISSVAHLIYKTSNPDLSLHNKHLKCSATLYDSAAITSMINVEFEPSIKCDRYTQEASIGDSVTFRCTVKSQPSSHVFWYPSISSRYRRGLVEMDSIDALDAIRLYNDVDVMSQADVSFTSTVLNDDETVHELQIANVQPHHFSMFFLHATNELASKKVTLQVDNKSF